jgi:hypothetical protein
MELPAARICKVHEGTRNGCFTARYERAAARRGTRQQRDSDACCRRSRRGGGAHTAEKEHLKTFEGGDGRRHFAHHVASHLMAIQVQQYDVMEWCSAQPWHELPQLVMRQPPEAFTSFFKTENYSCFFKIDLKFAVLPAAFTFPQVELSRELLGGVQRDAEEMFEGHGGDGSGRSRELVGEKQTEGAKEERQEEQPRRECRELFCIQWLSIAWPRAAGSCGKRREQQRREMTCDCILKKEAMCNRYSVQLICRGPLR